MLFPSYTTCIRCFPRINFCLSKQASFVKFDSSCSILWSMTLLRLYLRKTCWKKGVSVICPCTAKGRKLAMVQLPRLLLQSGTVENPSPRFSAHATTMFSGHPGTSPFCSSQRKLVFMLAKDRGMDDHAIDASSCLIISMIATKRKVRRAIQKPQ